MLKVGTRSWPIDRGRFVRRREFVTALAGGAAGVGAGKLIWGRGGSSWPAEARMTFSQQGEDIVLFHVVRDLLKVEKATYMDVGAAEPVLSNNTYLLWGVGHRGVLVEPNPALAKKLRDYRSGDKVVEAGVGVTDQTEADYYEIKGNPMLNTFSPDWVKDLRRGASRWSACARCRSSTSTGSSRSSSGKAPDVLSTDIEGMDYSIIKSLDLSRFRPGAICAETVAMSPAGDTSEITTYLLSQGYCVRGGSTINTIYVDSKRL